MEKEEFFLEADFVVGSGDYHHLEQKVLPAKYRRYGPKYWESRVMSPASLNFYLGINKKLQNLQHHNLFFDTDFVLHGKEIYERPQWPSDPLFYVCCPSQSDKSVAPEGQENLFILIPVATKLVDTEKEREKYYQMVIERLEKWTEQEIASHVILKRSYAHRDFEKDYFAFGGNAYGLANTLGQTAVFKPKMRSKLKNFFFAGQLTVPGPGLPPALYSGKMAAMEIKKALHKEGKKW